MAFKMDDYVAVNERIEAFYKKYPTGAIQSEIHTLTDKLVIVKSSAYRAPDDTHPCIAHSQLGIPGATNYTKGSEVENAETSAVGRALAMMGFEVKRGLASREEVRNKATSDETTTSTAPATTVEPEWQGVLGDMLKERNMKSSDLSKALGGGTVSVARIQEYLDKSGVNWKLALEGLVLSAAEQKKEGAAE